MRSAFSDTSHIISTGSHIDEEHGKSTHEIQPSLRWRCSRSPQSLRASSTTSTEVAPLLRMICQCGMLGPFWTCLTCLATTTSAATYQLGTLLPSQAWKACLRLHLSMATSGKGILPSPSPVPMEFDAYPERFLSVDGMSPVWLFSIRCLQIVASTETLPVGPLEMLFS